MTAAKQHYFDHYGKHHAKIPDCLPSAIYVKNEKVQTIYSLNISSTRTQQ